MGNVDWHFNGIDFGGKVSTLKQLKISVYLDINSEVGKLFLNFWTDSFPPLFKISQIVQLALVQCIQCEA